MLSYFERRPPEQFLHYWSFPNNGVRNHASQRPGLYLPQTPWVMWSIFINFGSPEVVKASATGTAPISPSGVVSQITFTFCNRAILFNPQHRCSNLVPLPGCRIRNGWRRHRLGHRSTLERLQGDQRTLHPSSGSARFKGKSRDDTRFKAFNIGKDFLLVQGSLGLPGLSVFQECKNLERFLGPNAPRSLMQLGNNFP